MTPAVEGAVALHGELDMILSNMVAVRARIEQSAGEAEKYKM